jgi:membrane fusion protein, multidrug efflux system
MTGDATLAPPQSAPDAAKTFRVPATAIFHRGKEPAVWVIRGQDSTLELRPVAVVSYGERSVLVSRGLSDGDTVLLAGVHTVYAGERVKAVKPLFSDDETTAAARSEAPP